ncbi:MAG: hypothetical protein RR280_02815 [Bacteroidaceae bacterium]
MDNLYLIVGAIIIAFVLMKLLKSCIVKIISLSILGVIVYLLYRYFSV